MKATELKGLEVFQEIKRKNKMFSISAKVDINTLKLILPFLFSNEKY